MVIEGKNISHYYPGNVLALDHITFRWENVSNIAIIGSNGSGKSTFLWVLNGLYIPKGGSLIIDGVSITEKNAKHLRKKTGYLFDIPDHQLFCPTVRDDIGFGLRHLGITPQDIDQKVQNIAQKLGFEDLLERAPQRLSLGQKKKVAIAGILVNDPELLILDEPFSGLDPVSKEEFICLLEEFGEGKIQIVATHDVDFVYAWADHVIILDKGRVLAEGAVDLLEQPLLLEQAGLRLPVMADIFKKNVYTVSQAKQLVSQWVKEE